MIISFSTLFGGISKILSKTQAIQISKFCPLTQVFPVLDTSQNKHPLINSSFTLLQVVRVPEDSPVTQAPRFPQVFPKKTGFSSSTKSFSLINSLSCHEKKPITLALFFLEKSLPESRFFTKFEARFERFFFRQLRSKSCFKMISSPFFRFNRFSL